MTDIPAWAVDDPDIAGSMRLLRRVPGFQVNNGIIDSSTFHEKEEGQGLSVTLWQSPSDLEDVLRSNEDFGVVCVAAEVFRSVGAIIMRAPLDGNPNHCEIFPKLTQSHRKKAKSAARWVHYPKWVEGIHRVPLESF